MEKGKADERLSSRKGDLSGEPEWLGGLLRVPELEALTWPFIYRIKFYLGFYRRRRRLWRYRRTTPAGFKWQRWRKQQRVQVSIGSRKVWTCC